MSAWGWALAYTVLPGIVTAYGVNRWFVQAERSGDRTALAKLRADVNKMGLTQRQAVALAGIVWPFFLIYILLARLP